MLNSISINELSGTPKYQQIVNSIVTGIEQDGILPGDKIPSIFELCSELNVSKRTVERAYNDLKKQDIIGGIQGKGFYINHTRLGHSKKIFLLFNKLSAHKKIIYDAFVQVLGAGTLVDFYIYNNDIRLFKSMLLTHMQGYSHYVIIPPYLDEDAQTTALLNQIPKNKLILLDKLASGVQGDYASVVQNFEKDLTQALIEALPLLQKYATINILFPFDSYHPRAILNGFYSFCYEHGFTAKVTHSMQALEIQPGSAYVSVTDEDLVSLVKKIKTTGYQVGRDVGILSYNETPLKEVLLDGITVMSTDFAQMGLSAASQIVHGSCQRLENPFHLIVRKSL